VYIRITYALQVPFSYFSKEVERISRIGLFNAQWWWRARRWILAAADGSFQLQYLWRQWWCAWWLFFQRRQLL